MSEALAYHKVKDTHNEIGKTWNLAATCLGCIEFSHKSRRSKDSLYLPGITMSIQRPTPLTSPLSSFQTQDRRTLVHEFLCKLAAGHGRMHAPNGMIHMSFNRGCPIGSGELDHDMTFIWATVLIGRGVDLFSEPDNLRIRDHGIFILRWGCFTQE